MQPTQQHSSTIRVQRTIKTSNDEQTSSDCQDIDVRVFHTTPATVSVTYPMKMTAGYQSIGIEVSVSIPCYKEEVPQALDEAGSLAVAHMKKELPNVEGVLKQLIRESNKIGSRS